MSADDWYECVFCKANAKKIVEEEYGKLPYEEFKEKLDEAKVEHPEHEGQPETIRSDFEIWMDEEGIWHFKGGCECALCGREWNADVKIKPTGKG